MIPFKKFVALLILVLVWSSCKSSQLQRLPDNVDERIQELQDMLGAAPNDIGTLRELGVLYALSRRPESGLPYLQQAYDLGDRESEMLFHLGLATETTVGMSEAIPIYAEYVGMPRSSRYRRYMQGRYQWLTREVAAAEMRQILDPESGFVPGEAPTTTVAVYPLTYQGGDARYQPLGRGLAEMFSIDLAQVTQLTLVERVRLNALLAEMNLGPYLEPSTAPQVGRLLRAGRIVGGGFDLLQNDRIRVDLASWVYDAQQTPAFQESSDALTNLFRFQKTLVFDLISDMGINLTRAEIQRIDFSPTRNLQAFLAFSRGLEEEDRGNYAAAAEQYRLAASIDPNFQLAADQAEAAESAEGMGGTVAALLELAILQGTTEGQSIDLMGDRVEKLVTESGLGIDIETTSDSRTPATEAASTIRSSLNDPPPPPRGND